MRIALVTNWNGIGLTRDGELLRNFLQSKGNEVFEYQWDGEAPTEKFDLVIFLEVIPRNFLELAPVKWAFLNPEWCKPDVIKMAERHIDRIFAKTHEGQRILEGTFPGKVFYTGFLTRDQFTPAIKRQKWFLHIGGNSSMRGTQAVVDAWKWKKDGFELQCKLFVVSSVLQDKPNLLNVTYIERATEEELYSLQNQCMFHIYPSGTEGFGHALHESLSVGAVLLATDAPPMNEISNAYRMKAKKVGKYNLSDVYEVDAIEIFESVQAVLTVYDGPPQSWHFPRKEFESLNAEFATRFEKELLAMEPGKKAPVVRTAKTKPSIAFIGNFKASESTENMIRWALEERLGYDVEQLQENEVNLAAIRSACLWNDALLWVKTPNWLQVTNREMEELLEEIKIPSFSIHLDKFWDITEREPQIGVHPFWKTDFVFTADGSAQDRFRERGVNHIWMKPAVSEVYCHPGWTWDMYRCDVGFVGAKDYHAQYPFRKQLVEFLEKTYKERFQHITGLRGHGLNDFYASCSVAIGDSIFAGTPYYYSDRAPETTGRQGFLLHPKVDGLCIPCATYQPQDLDDLRNQIDFWIANPQQRREKIIECFDHVISHDTWTVRLREILRIVFDGHKAHF